MVGQRSIPLEVFTDILTYLETLWEIKGRRLSWSRKYMFIINSSSHLFFGEVKSPSRPDIWNQALVRLLSLWPKIYGKEETNMLMFFHHVFLDILHQF